MLIDKIIITDQFYKYKNQKSKNVIYITINTFDNSKNIISIPIYIEKNSKELKTSYLKFVKNIGKQKIGKKHLYEYNQINKNHFLWWQSNINEKSNFSKSKEINKIIKVFAIIKILAIYKRYSIFFDVEDANIKKIFKNYSDVKQKIFLVNYAKKLFIIMNNFFYKLKNIFIGLIWLLFYIKKNFKIFLEKNNYSNLDNKLTIFTYNQEYKQTSNKLKIVDKYWTELFTLFDRKKIKYNVISIFVNNSKFKTSYNYIKYIKSFENIYGGNKYSLLESYLNFKIIYNSLFTYANILFKNFYIKESKLFKHDNLNLFELIKKDYYSSFFGKDLIKNIIYTNLFDNIFSKIEKKSKIFYLNENNFWEYSLLSNAKKYDISCVISFPHILIKKWDLRAFTDNEVISKNRKINYYLPDIICAFGNLNFKSLKEQYKDKVKIEKVEALRFLKYQSLNFSEKQISNIKKINILIFGEYDYDMNKKIIKFVCESKCIKNKNYKFFYKPHPATKAVSYLPSHLIKILKRDLQDINFDIVICSSWTSASLDSAALNIPFITILDQEMPNFSPFNKKESKFIYSPKDLKRTIEKIKKNKPVADLKNMFFFDKNLYYWSKLLDSIL